MVTGDAVSAGSTPLSETRSDVVHRGHRLIHHTLPLAVMRSNELRSCLSNPRAREGQSPSPYVTFRTRSRYPSTSIRPSCSSRT